VPATRTRYVPQTSFEARSESGYQREKLRQGFDAPTALRRDRYRTVRLV
jgi:hypothetical protein